MITLWPPVAADFQCPLGMLLTHHFGEIRPGTIRIIEYTPRRSVFCGRMELNPLRKSTT